jgi:DNA-binding NtrC family response regulator
VAFADAGTLFLDEIGTLALTTQAKLLTLLEQHNFQPLGTRSAHPTAVDVRFICATNVPLQRSVEEGTFRADVFHRLNGITIELPPLRDREGDVELLARHFTAEFGNRHGKRDLGMTDQALAAMQRYPWPGNVRELQQVLAAAVVLADGAVSPDDLPDHVRSSPGAAGGSAAPTSLNLREIKEWAGREAQKRIIEELQKRTNITRQEMARMLGIDPKTLRSRLKEIAPRTTRQH